MNDGERLDTTDRWFAANLKAARERAGLSQEAVAEQMREHGFPRFRQQTVVRVETGERAVRIGEGFALAAATGTSLAALAQPPELVRDSMVLRAATARLRQLRDEAAAAPRRAEEARLRLESLVATLREAGRAAGLESEIRDAEAALAEAGTQSDEAPDARRPVPGPAQAAGPNTVT